MVGTRASLTQLIAAGVLDAQLSALLWLLAERGVPLVAAAATPRDGEVFRSAIGSLARARGTTDDGALPGGTLIAHGLEDVLRLAGNGDEARDLGVVCILAEGREPASTILSSAHYVRPIERDVAGHLQRRPPALLSARDAAQQRLDHFFWAITDELATRAAVERAEFNRAYERRLALLVELVAAGVLDPDHVRRHVAHAILGEAAARDTGADAPN